MLRVIPSFERNAFNDNIRLELTSLRKKYDLRGGLKWREHVEQTREKVSRRRNTFRKQNSLKQVTTIILNKMHVRFDWFDVPEELSIATICQRKAVNLVSETIGE